MKLKSMGFVIVSIMLAFTACTTATGDSSSSASTAESRETGMRTEEINHEIWYYVETETQLRSIADDDTALAQNYIQQADIELTSEWISIGNDAHPFTGKYNGNSYTISGLYYPEGEKEYTGLFGYSKGGELRNITLVAPDTTHANGTHNGAIVALCLDGGGSYDNTVLEEAAASHKGE